MEHGMTRMKLIYQWLDDRLGISSTIMPIIQHPVPPNLTWWYVLGSATLVAFVMQVVTGVALAFTYVPAPSDAYESLEFITQRAVLGNIVRGIHYWGSSAMVVLMFLHMASAYLMAAYKYPRELTWVSGVFLLALTLAMAFTGQLLRWNQDAYWAIVLVAAQVSRVPVIGNWLTQLVVAGQTVGGATLTRFYATHVFLIPALTFGLIGIHLYMMTRHGVSEPPKTSGPVDPATYRQRYHEKLSREGVPFWPDFAWKDVVFALVAGSIVLLLAIVFGAPELGERADPTLIQAHPKPDWYFLWLYALAALIPPELEIVMTLGMGVVGVALVILPFVAPFGERRASRRPWAIAVVGFATLAIGVLLWEGFRAPWSPALHARLPKEMTVKLQGSAVQGGNIFQQKGCMNCHIVAGAGGLRGPELSDVASRLSREQLTWRILYGAHNMPAYATTLRPEELNALVDFLGSQHGTKTTKGH
jgi:ubiquinol-cytochrome c reductase cytochrome b subunit